MTKDIDVAQYIYKQKGWIDSWRLQKLTYYAQAWGLAWTGCPLFDDPIQAWDDGPVAPELYRTNKWSAGHMSTTLPGADLALIDANSARVIDAVLAFYGGYSKQSLIDLTHAEGPWLDNFEAGRNREIPKRSMVGYYSNLTVSGGPVPSRPDLKEHVSTERDLAAEAKFQMSAWSRTLELLAR